MSRSRYWTSRRHWQTRRLFSFMAQRGREKQPYWMRLYLHCMANPAATFARVQHCGPPPPPRTRVTEVEYVFALGRRRFRVLRSPAYERMSRGKKTRRAATGQLYRLPDEGEDGEETLLDSNVTEVSKRIGQLIGFDADQFRQVVLLPQGQFQRFLLAEA